MEPRISGSKADDFIRRSGFTSSFRVEATGFSGGIWVLWKDNVQVDIIAVSDQFIHAICADTSGNNRFYINFVYASPTRCIRQGVWAQLQALEPLDLSPWVLGGDFNVIGNPSERSGGSQARSGVCTRFTDFLFDTGLLDMGFHGPMFTWRRGNLAQRLDRCLCSSNWYSYFPSSEVYHLQRLGSDHRPVLLVTDMVHHASSNTRPFRYIHAWSEHPDFANLVQRSWDGSRTVVENISNFCEESRAWNWNVFGHIGKRKCLLLARIRGVEKVLENSSSDFLISLEKDLKLELARVLDQEESLWHQKSRATWIEKGDRNTRYFHAATPAKRRRNTVRVLKDSAGQWCDDEERLKTFAVEFFENLYTSEPRVGSMGPMGKFHSFRTEELRTMVAEVTMKEVREVVFSMPPLKAPRCDGLPVAFF
ncbi:hypothetical protein HRI_003998100 [Hibiscus trionum]|uniref:Endonuclease/exonuclease/phosphatase domain-containing protein n=1 Tax=Hibiscus trionum TaxID=183268 RepID=A0A9W7IXX4_HIBTR|nr:hypothetical protein HRI_003998100 [Hibiscus trionum]